VGEAPPVHRSRCYGRSTLRRSGGGRQRAIV
jgi:hypothetical protein